MFRLILPVIICLAEPLSAQSIKSCPSGDNQICDQILACIGAKGRWFHGLALGLGPWSSVTGSFDNGIACTGQRLQYNKVMTGEITLECTDGARGTVIYENHFPHESYGTGHTTLNDGRALQVWVAQDLKAALRFDVGSTVARLPCPGGAIRLD